VLKCVTQVTGHGEHIIIKGAGLPVWNPDKTGSNRYSSTSTANTTSHSSDNENDSESDEDTDDVEATVGDMNITVSVQFPTENFSSRHQRSLHISDDSFTDIEVIDLDD
jgi:hypothetical protein